MATAAYTNSAAMISKSCARIFPTCPTGGRSSTWRWRGLRALAGTGSHAWSFWDPASNCWPRPGARARQSWPSTGRAETRRASTASPASFQTRPQNGSAYDELGRAGSPTANFPGSWRLEWPVIRFDRTQEFGTTGRRWPDLYAIVADKQGAGKG